MGLLDTLKEQEWVDFRLILALAVVIVLGIGVFLWFQMAGGDDSVGDAENTYHCHFDDATVTVSNTDFFSWRADGNAIMNDRNSGCPQRVRCPECNRMSCFKLDRETNAEIEVNDEWDLSEEAEQEQMFGTPRD